MPELTRTVSPGPRAHLVRAEDGKILNVPAGWVLLPPGDAALTRRVKAAGPCWICQEKKGRRNFTRGVWAPANRIEAIRSELLAERSTEAYAKRRVADAGRREAKQSLYIEDFRGAVLEFLAFSPSHAELARQLADAVTEHATPVGSGTVARTQRISIARRAAAAVFAWLRHQTTAYDTLKIPRVKGKRREVRRNLAGASRRLLARYRAGEAIAPDACLLRQALVAIAARRGPTNGS